MPFALLTRLWPTIKDIFYVVIIAALIGGVVMVIHHERVIGAAAVKTADARVAQAAEIKNAKVETLVQSRLADALHAYEKANPPAPPAPVPRVVCYSARRSGEVSGRRASVSPSDGAGASVPQRAAPEHGGFDPASRLSAGGSAADHEIAHLLKKIRFLQATIRAYQAAGLVKR